MATQESLSILIIGPNASSRQALRAGLAAAAGWNLSIREASDEATALRELKEKHCDLILLACCGRDGLPVLARLRQLHPKSAVILSCEQPDATLVVEAMQIGALDFLPRGQIERIDFSSILRRLVHTRTLVDQNMELRQVNEMKNEFISNVSHELRTPLTVILGYARTLQDGAMGALNEDQLKAVSSIAARSEELLATLNQILRVRDSVEKRQLAELKPLDLRVLWSAAAERAARDLTRKQLRVEPRLPADPVWVMADQKAFSEACDNLLSNAIKFSPEGGTIRLSVTVSGNFAESTVEDSGPGVPPEMLAHVFEDFSTASVSGPTRARSGLGLGLALCKQTVELHSGTVWLECPGHGCAAHVRLPLARPDGNQTKVERPVLVEKRRVLIVEDNLDLIEIVRFFVTSISANLELAVANTGFEALDSIKNQMPHLIIMDIMMPGMTGLELLERLRRVPESQRVPVLVLTGYSNAAERARAAGAQDVLIKPFDRAVFVSKVLALLHQEPSAKNP
jgi:signal transduction histidine kinase